MMRFVQKLDKFDTNNQKIDQVSKFYNSYQKSNIALMYEGCLIISEPDLVTTV
jgi:hypothetical protein